MSTIGRLVADDQVTATTARPTTAAPPPPTISFDLGGEEFFFGSPLATTPTPTPSEDPPTPPRPTAQRARVEPAPPAVLRTPTTGVPSPLMRAITAALPPASASKATSSAAATTPATTMQGVPLPRREKRPLPGANLTPGAPRFAAPPTTIAPERFPSPPPKTAEKRQAVFKTPPFAPAGRAPASPMDTGLTYATTASSPPQPPPRTPQSAPAPNTDGNTAAPKPAAPGSTAAANTAAATNTTATPTAPKASARYPPLVVDVLPDWPTHFRELKKVLGHAPNGRPFGKGVRFIPKSDTEYRAVQHYLCGLEKETGLHWFSYSLPAEQSLKIAIRGLPANTDPAAVEQELRELGYSPEYVRAIRTRSGRPGCLLHAQLTRTPDLTPGIYQVTELLCMPGVTIEAWRGKRGPAQCHRCQQFRHSSHNCHRQLACVRCGGEHAAKSCPRPLESPPTCANCGGEHTANNATCPVFRREARNKRAGTVARTTATKTPAKTSAAAHDTEADAPGSLMAAANPAQAGAASGGAKRKRGKRRRPRNEAAASSQPPKTQERAKAPVVAAPQGGTKAKQVPADPNMTLAIGALTKALVALQEGRDPVPAILQCLADLYAHGR